MNVLWLDLLNSDYHDYKGGGKDEDRLENPLWMKNFLKKWELSFAERENQHTVKQLRSLRTLIRRMADDFRLKKELKKNDLMSLNKILERAPSIIRIEMKDNRCSISRVGVNQGLESILAGIAASFAEVLVNGEPERIKICENKDCLWIFYDNSKNKSRKWCEGGTGCGNLMKVRRFREKHNDGV